MAATDTSRAAAARATAKRFTAAERRLVARLRTPLAVQQWLNALPYNAEASGETLRSFRPVVRTGQAHCLEAALFAAVVLEQHGYPPLVMSLESVDLLDHVLFVYQRRGRWGSVARSRDPGLHGTVGGPTGMKPARKSWSLVSAFPRTGDPGSSLSNRPIKFGTMA